MKIGVGARETLGTRLKAQGARGFTTFAGETGPSTPSIDSGQAGSGHADSPATSSPRLRSGQAGQAGSKQLGTPSTGSGQVGTKHQRRDTMTCHCTPTSHKVGGGFFCAAPSYQCVVPV